jgi:S1-C subfamily serine protease
MPAATRHSPGSSLPTRAVRRRRPPSRLAALLVLLLAMLTSAGATAAETRDVVRGMMVSTAQLLIERDSGARRTGSSIVLAIDRDADRTLLVTAAHVVAPLAEQTVRVLIGVRREAFAGTVLAVDEEWDLALVEVHGLNVQVAPVEPVRLAPHAMLGDEVLVASFPWGRRATLVRGMVSQIAWSDGEVLSEIPLEGAVALIDASVSHGMSGGGVFDRYSGELVGIVRGYRTTRVTLPGATEPAISLPIAGETTVVPTTRILCFLAEHGHAGVVPAQFGTWMTPDDCADDSTAH